MDEITSLPGIVAVSAAGLALVALVVAVVASARLRRLRSAQRTVLGEHGQRDLVDHAQRLEDAFSQLQSWVEEVLTSIDERMTGGERRIDGCVAHRALVRYDAYGELSGRQSSSLALLDSDRSGVVISSILHRDHARVYIKQVVEGESELELSPEEHEAVETALAPTPV